MWVVATFALVRSARAGGPEVCNGYDDDGDGAVDEGPVWAAPDGDGDGYGSDDAGALFVDCGQVPGAWLPDVSDCDDTDGDVHPGHLERCNAVDDDCDGEFDQGACDGAVDTEDTSAWLFVLDVVDWWEAEARCELQGAGWALGTPSSSQQQEGLERYADPYDVEFWIGLSDLEEEGVFRWLDGAAVTFDAWDFEEPNDYGYGEDCAVLRRTGVWDDRACDGLDAFVCEHACVQRLWYADDDGDGFGDPTASNDECEWLPSLVANALDCDDGDPNEPSVWYVDADGDGVGADASAEVRCFAPGAGLVAVGGDCADGDAAVFPGAEEIDGDEVDQNCDGFDGVPPDADGDGLFDPDELEVYGTDPFDPDTDGDTLGDGEEVAAGTDPLSDDSDADGLGDAAEGLGVDTDRDGRIDPLDPDDDGDGLATADEGADDVDGDGVPNHLDLDSDGDGAHDGAEGLDRAYDAGGDEDVGEAPAAALGCDTGRGGVGAALGALVLVLLARRRRLTAGSVTAGRSGSRDR